MSSSLSFPSCQRQALIKSQSLLYSSRSFSATPFVRDPEEAPRLGDFAEAASSDKKNAGFLKGHQLFYILYLCAARVIHSQKWGQKQDSIQVKQESTEIKYVLLPDGT